MAFTKRGEYAVFLTRSTGHAYQVEKVLSTRSIVCKLIPVPRNLSSDCGMCVRIDRSSLERAVMILGDEGIEVESVHEL